MKGFMDMIIKKLFKTAVVLAGMLSGSYLACADSWSWLKINDRNWLIHLCCGDFARRATLNSWTISNAMRVACVAHGYYDERKRILVDKTKPLTDGELFKPFIQFVIEELLVVRGLSTALSVDGRNNLVSFFKELFDKANGPKAAEAGGKLLQSSGEKIMWPVLGLTLAQIFAPKFLKVPEDCWINFGRALARSFMQIPSVNAL